MNRPYIALVLIGCCIAMFLTVHTRAEKSEKKGRSYFESRGEVVWEVPTKQKVVALTFDDGPNPLYTPQILDLLKHHHAKATFFVVVTRVQKYPELVRREVDEGHEVANHSLSIGD